MSWKIKSSSQHQELGRDNNDNEWCYQGPSKASISLWCSATDKCDITAWPIGQRLSSSLWWWSLMKCLFLSSSSEGKEYHHFMSSKMALLLTHLLLSATTCSSYCSGTAAWCIHSNLWRKCGARSWSDWFIGLMEIWRRHGFQLQLSPHICTHLVPKL